MMILRKGAVVSYFFLLCVRIALLTTSSASGLSHMSSSVFSFSAIHHAKASSAASPGIMTATATIAAATAVATANHVGAAAVHSGLAVHSSFLHGGKTFFPSLCAVIVRRSLQAAVITAAGAAVVHQVTSQPLRALAVSAGDDQQKGEGTPATRDETFLTGFIQQLSSIEIPTFSAALSSGTDRIASSIFSHFFPDAQLPPHGTPPSGAYFSLQNIAPKIGSTIPVGSGRADERAATDRTDNGIAATKGVAAGTPTAAAASSSTAAASSSTAASSSAAARAPAASVIQPPPVPSRPVPPAPWLTSNNDRCSSLPPGRTGQKVSASPLSEGELPSRTASDESCPPDSSSSLNSPSVVFSDTSSSLESTAATATQTQQVCTSAAIQQGRCTKPSITTTASASTDAAASGQQEPAGSFFARRHAPPFFGDVELLGSLLERPHKANVAGLSDVQEFLSSLDFSDPVLLTLLGFHLVLVAAVLCCRRMHVAQLMLMCFVSLLLLCSKQLLMLCSLVEQKLRTDDSLASAIAAFSPSSRPAVPASSPSSSVSSSFSAAAPQFYCSPSATSRATLFLLLFWWAPLITVLLLLVGTLLHELVASLRLLARHKVKAATKRRQRSGDGTVTAATAEAAEAEAAAAATSTLCALSAPSKRRHQQSHEMPQ